MWAIVKVQSQLQMKYQSQVRSYFNSLMTQSYITLGYNIIYHIQCRLGHLQLRLTFESKQQLRMTPEVKYAKRDAERVNKMDNGNSTKNQHNKNTKLVYRHKDRERGQQIKTATVIKVTEKSLSFFLSELFICLRSQNGKNKWGRGWER